MRKRSLVGTAAILAAFLALSVPAIASAGGADKDLAIAGAANGQATSGFGTDGSDNSDDNTAADQDNGIGNDDITESTDDHDKGIGNDDKDNKNKDEDEASDEAADDDQAVDNDDDMTDESIGNQNTEDDDTDHSSDDDAVSDSDQGIGNDDKNQDEADDDDAVSDSDQGIGNDDITESTDDHDKGIGNDDKTPKMAPISPPSATPPTRGGREIAADQAVIIPPVAPPAVQAPIQVAVTVPVINPVIQASPAPSRPQTLADAKRLTLAPVVKAPTPKPPVAVPEVAVSPPADAPFVPHAPAGVTLEDLLSSSSTADLSPSGGHSIAEAARQAAASVAVPALAMTVLTALGWAIKPAGTKAASILAGLFG